MVIIPTYNHSTRVTKILTVVTGEWIFIMVNMCIGLLPRQVLVDIEL